MRTSNETYNFYCSDALEQFVKVLETDEIVDPSKTKVVAKRDFVSDDDMEHEIDLEFRYTNGYDMSIAKVRAQTVADTINAIHVNDF